MKNIRLKDIAIVTSGNSAPQNDKMFEDGIYPFVRTSDVGRVHLSASFTKPEDYLNETGIKGMKLFPKDSILFPKSGASTLLNHRVLLGEDSYVVSHLAVIVPDKRKVVPLYLYYYTTRIDAGELVNDRAYPSLKTSILEQVSLNLPSFPEQERIVAELDLLTGIIDKQKAQLAELDTLAQSIFYDMFGDPIENEKGWDSSLFKDTIRLKSGDGLPEKDFRDGKYPVYGGNGISGYHNTYNKEGNHIIIGRVGAYCGNVRYVKGLFWLTDNAFQAFFDTDKFDFYYLCFLLNAIDLHRYANQAAQPVISNVGLKDISIICPPKEFQESFAQKIQSIESQKASINRSIAETQKLFDYTMDKYFG